MKMFCMLGSLRTNVSVADQQVRSWYWIFSVSKGYHQVFQLLYMKSTIIEKYKSERKRILRIFDDMFSDMIIHPVVAELFIRSERLKISFVFITQPYLPVQKHLTLNTTHFFIIKIPNRQKFQQIAGNHSCNIDSKDFLEIHWKCTAKLHYFLVIDTTLPSDNTLHFCMNLLGKV